MWWGRFKSQNRFVIEAINYYERVMRIQEDPYLETREKEDAFADRIVSYAAKGEYADYVKEVEECGKTRDISKRIEDNRILHDEQKKTKYVDMRYLGRER